MGQPKQIPWLSTHQLSCAKTVNSIPREAANPAHFRLPPGKRDRTQCPFERALLGDRPSKRERRLVPFESRITRWLLCLLAGELRVGQTKTATPPRTAHAVNRRAPKAFFTSDRYHKYSFVSSDSASVFLEEVRSQPLKALKSDHVVPRVAAAQARHGSGWVVRRRYRGWIRWPRACHVAGSDGSDPGESGNLAWISAERTRRSFRGLRITLTP